MFCLIGFERFLCDGIMRKIVSWAIACWLLTSVGKKVFDAGWGQRHGFSGVKIPRALMGGKLIELPSEYVLVYAPRTKEEVTLVLGLTKASLRYLTGEEVQ